MHGILGLCGLLLKAVLNNIIERIKNKERLKLKL